MEFKYGIGNIIKNKYSSFIINNRKYENYVKSYNCTCLTCNYNFNIKEGNLNRNQGCSVCSHHKVLKGYNDLWTTRPEIAKYLTNKDDGYTYAQFSNKKLQFTCPICQNYIGTKALNNVSKQGISCPKCGDKKSFPNKFMFNILDQLNVNFDPEVKFDWCEFQKYNSELFTFGIYDFVLWDYKLIIEMNSGLGHGNNIYTNSDISIEETLYRDNQKKILAENHGYTVIYVDCQYYGTVDRFTICKTGVLNSELIKYINLKKIDWELVYKYCVGSIVKNVCDLYNQGYSTKEISINLKKDQSSVIDYLKRGTECGFCNFIPGDHKSKKVS